MQRGQDGGWASPGEGCPQEKAEQRGREVRAIPKDTSSARDAGTLASQPWTFQETSKSLFGISQFELSSVAESLTN